MILAYLLFAFLQYYFRQNGFGYEIVSALGCASDICYFIFIVGWLNIIGELSGKLPQISRKLIITVTAVYGTAVEIIALSTGGGWRTALIVLNCIYCISVFILSALHFYLTASDKEKTYRHRSVMFFSAVLCIYMLWTLAADYERVYQTGRSLLSNVIVDPLLVLYCIIDVFIIFFFFRKDPLELFSGQSEVKQAEQLELFAAAHGLTPREAEVLKLVCDGLNNPAIAENLCISEHTVKRHMNSIFQKSGAANRYELITNVLSK